MTSPIEKLRDYGYELPSPKAPVGAYVAVSRSGNLLYVSGQLSNNELGVVEGRLGETMNVVQGSNAAELCALNVLAHVANSAGVPLEKVSHILKITVLVASTPDFTEQHLVANGASDLFVTVLGDKGRHARAAFGVASLPLGAAVEVDAIIEVES
jgi:enamine deaminase RidA (YjgF/YER057c/UK114 family)